MIAPARTPKEVISRLAGWVSAALQAPEINAKFDTQGLIPVGLCGADFANFTREQYDQFGREIRNANIKEE